MRIHGMFIFLFIIGMTAFLGGIAEGAVYVGSKICGECHQKEYETFSKFAKKASSFESIKKMKSKLTSEEYRSCFECHTTGHGKPGGFVSESETPELRNVGCEECHGPGSVHAEYGDPAEIKSNLTIGDCKQCHNSERVRAFDFTPLLYGGAH